MVTIRLSRGGSKMRPFYHLTLTDHRNARDGRFNERIGLFNPKAQGHTHRLRVDLEGVDHWIGLGAKTSDRVKRLIKDARQAA